MRLGSGSGKQANWRLRKTLARKLEFRPSELEDIKYVWAAYKKGALVDMAEPFNDTSMNAEEFRAALEYAIITRYDGTWTFIAETKLGFIPVGMLFAFWPGKVKEHQPYMIIGDLAWFPWASSRNKIESAVNFFSKIRNEIPMVDYAYGETNKRFFTTVAKHGVMQRVGTTYNVKRGEPVAIFETRAT